MEADNSRDHMYNLEGFDWKWLPTSFQSETNMFPICNRSEQEKFLFYY